MIINPLLRLGMTDGDRTQTTCWCLNGMKFGYDRENNIQFNLHKPYNIKKKNLPRAVTWIH